jgi:hypothetical protein
VVSTKFKKKKAVQQNKREKEKCPSERNSKCPLMAKKKKKKQR